MSAVRIMITGTHSGVGKTTVATGIMAALHKRGLRVQGFKVGPDFIDPGYHQAAAGRPSHNLDGWMLTRKTNLEIFSRATADADVAVIEGVMGLFDGKSAASLAGTTAEMAIWLGSQNVLVLDGSAMAGSAAALVHGFDTLIPEFRLSAVICNKVASARHFNLLHESITMHCRPSTLGYLPRDAGFSLPERHLGLHLAQEVMTAERMTRLAEWIESHLDLDKLLERPSVADDLPLPPDSPTASIQARIGVARDAAFCFYYHDNLEMLRRLGAELVAFSPTSDGSLPPGLDGLYLGGGYPELHAKQLSANNTMRSAISEFADKGGPIYAECGGFMYLTEAIVDLAGDRWAMAGIFPTIARMQVKLAKLGYVEIEDDGIKARGHEFRYSAIDPMPDCIRRAYQPPAEGYRIHSVLGSYIHLHFGSCPDFAERFVHDCAIHRARNAK